MKTRTAILFVATHLAVAAAGFAGGIYALPILTAPAPPTMDEIKAATGQGFCSPESSNVSSKTATLHWGEGHRHHRVSPISFVGKPAPGARHKLYLSPEFVENQSDFNRLKNQMVGVGDVKTFENFVVTVPGGIDPAKYSAVIVWCESFGQFITAAKYR